MNRLYALDMPILSPTRTIVSRPASELSRRSLSHSTLAEGGNTATTVEPVFIKHSSVGRCMKQRAGSSRNSPPYAKYPSSSPRLALLPWLACTQPMEPTNMAPIATNATVCRSSCPDGAQSSSSTSRRLHVNTSKSVFTACGCASEGDRITISTFQSLSTSTGLHHSR